MRLRRRRPWFRCDCGFVIQIGGFWILLSEVAECEAVTQGYTHLSCYQPYHTILIVSKTKTTYPVRRYTIEC